MLIRNKSWYLVVPRGTSWFHVVPHGTSWFHVVPRGTSWCFVIYLLYQLQYVTLIPHNWLNSLANPWPIMHIYQLFVWPTIPSNLLLSRPLIRRQNVDHEWQLRYWWVLRVVVTIAIVSVILSCKSILAEMTLRLCLCTNGPQARLWSL